MAKKKKKKKKKAKAKRQARKQTCIAFLREVYGSDPNISNDKVLTKLLAKFPQSNAGVKSIITWKNMLRKEGFDIPMSRVGRKTTKKKASKKKAAKKKTRKRKK